MIQPRSLEALAPRLIGQDGKPLLNSEVLDSQAVNGYLTEGELLDGDEEADMSILPQEVMFVTLTPAVIMQHVEYVLLVKSCLFV